MQLLLSRTENVPLHRPIYHDQALHAEVTEVLNASGYRSFAGLKCRIDRGTVELAGVVPTFYLKQLGQEAVLRLNTVKQIRNRVQVIC
jgi:hypothetical protein